jgi:DNA-binding NarL/FixJ family response regulator
LVPAAILALVVQQPAASDDQTAREKTLSLLTDREIQVFLLLERGLGRNDIAETLHLSPNTVRTHIHRILRRLDVHSTLAALALARG